MSDNPFASVPESHDPAKMAVLQKAPGALTLILVCCLILGIMGLGGSCMGGMMYAFSSTFEKMAMDTAMDDASREMQKINFASAKKAGAFGLVLTGLNLIVGSMLIIGSIGGLRRKESGRKLLGFAVLAAIFYSLLKIVFYVYNQVVTSAGMKEGVENLKGNPVYDDLQTLVTFTSMIAWAGVVFFVLIGLAMLGFYVWAKLYLNKDQVVKYFASQNQ